METPLLFYMRYPKDNCPGDGFLWNPEKEVWFRPKTPQEYSEWFYKVHLGQRYDPAKDTHPMTQQEFERLLASHKAPPKGFAWY